MRVCLSSAALLAAVTAAGLAQGQAEDPLAGLIDGARPAAVIDGVAPVTSANTRRDPVTGLIDVLLTPDPGLPARPVVDPAATDVVAGMLRRLHAAGAAGGLAGVLYDNRDSGHSVPDLSRFPQLARTRYDDAFRQQNLHHGVAARVRFSLPVIGNSSTALTRGPLARSLGRLALQDQAAARRSYLLYVSNHLYIYPEHRDYDPGTGDRLLGNAPYFMLSQGSSRSDRPFITTALAIIAALPPATRVAAETSGRLAATVQAVLRRTLAGINGDADYLSPSAHPPVMPGDRLRPAMAVRLASTLAPDTLPPRVTIAVERDLAARPGLDYLTENLGEVLYTTPMAVARAWRSFAHERTVTLRADATPAPDAGRDLRFHWVLLQGDPTRVTIRTRGDGDSVADIDLAWHPRQEPTPARPIATSRVDIAVIADAGGAMSAPAVFSVLFPTHQQRVYRADARGQFRLEALHHARPDDPSQGYADPLVWPVAPWQDEILRDTAGRVRGLRRTREDGTRAVLTRSETGWVLDGRAVRHQARPDAKGVLHLRVTARPPQ